MSQITECAKLIRKELKEFYPNIKFSVTGSSFSMGTEITIKYNSETELSNLKDIVSKYQTYSYNHYEDIQETKEDPENEHLPKVKYVTVQRN